MPQRKRIRVDWDDYNEGLYFLTVCTHDFSKQFGEIYESEMYLSDLGKYLEEGIKYADNDENVSVINFVIMPNHFHIIVSAVGTRYIASAANERKLGALKPPTHSETMAADHHNSIISTTIGGIKAAVTRYAHKNNISFRWQERYFDHIIRNEGELEAINHYINNNIVKWKDDRFYRE